MSKGILSRSAAVMIPLAQRAEHWHFNSMLRSLLVFSIRDYQRYLSPHKGFSCAHRRVYGGVSCSEYLRRSVQNESLVDALSHFQQRLRACKQASRIFNAGHSHRRRKKREAWGDCGAGWCDSSCIPLDVCDLCDLDCDLSPDCDALEGLDGCIDCGECDCGW
ncbi:membrane protein insertion efficiency factor YidD [Acaryochloris sp. IP29b_bin.148]|uniref:membrane protein insertion efficiency factor YidD n=1 Tax=Acaryochloris sp. IP29b_bin.148 TaxID=2969218 RepID=UPI00262CAF22|nr:membrane protein insertion efficiency factor YidD [Acaryochloris sp. IP29b_bin.148]